MRRRIFILGGVTAVVAAGPAPAGARQRQVKASAAPYPFPLGVASGEPDAGSVVLWTRLATDPLNADDHGGMPDADVPVDWQVATTEQFTRVVARGTVVARYADAHSVHVVAGGLSPDAEYFYRFRARGHISAVGRTRTAPEGQGTLRMAFASCADFQSGYYTAYRRMAEDRPDLILHLGDYIYESGAIAGAVRRHAGANEIVSLADYRRRYAQYRSDPDLQAAHAVAPWLVVPDDHEVENNYAGLARADGVPSLTAAQWAARRAAAYRAYYENMPLRPAQAPSGNSIRLYRRVRWGRLATFHMLDTRQFRDDQACGDGWKNCGDAPGRSLPGRAQEAWLLNGLGQNGRGWDVIGQQVFFAAQTDADGAGNMDAWDGYRASRARIQQGWRDRNVRNPLVLTGDVHAAWACDLKADYREPRSATIGTELVCTSITSGGDGTASTAVPRADVNPHLRFYSNRRGYTLTTIGPAQVRADFRAVASVTEQDAPATTLKSFVIQDARPGVREI